MQYHVLIVDLVFLVMVAAIAQISKRTWAMWATAFQVLVILTHLSFILVSNRWVEYLTLLALWGYLVMGSIGLGALMAWRQRR